MSARVEKHEDFLSGDQRLDVCIDSAIGRGQVCTSIRISAFDRDRYSGEHKALCQDMVYQFLDEQKDDGNITIKDIVDVGMILNVPVFKEMRQDLGKAKREAERLRCQNRELLNENTALLHAVEIG